jgi:methylase of polypeptide subunit release factors
MSYGLENLLADLKYDVSPYYRTRIDEFELETAHLFRAAREIDEKAGKVNGIYVFQTSENKVLPNRPAVFIVKANDEKGAHVIHRSLWNLGYAPFILMVLPDQVRIYTGFDYSTLPGKESGLLDTAPLARNALRNILFEFSTDSIDIGQIWHSQRYKSKITPSSRVDKRLLKNLRELGKALKGVGDLSAEVAHALIGKYVYIKYLWDKGILTEKWMNDKHIAKEEVLGRQSTVNGLAKLIQALEDRFNGEIFPIKDIYASGLEDNHVYLTASVFMGDSLHAYTNRVIQQLYLEFQAYDFRYIPVETLSAVYEQFIENPKGKGAIYTPEAVADYLLSEVQSIEPLSATTKVLDPACGSGVFLVLIYRRMIEQKLFESSADRLRADELIDLLHNIYGVELEQDACYVAEFSLILTLLHYVEPRELDKSKFKFPILHNRQIFHGDFFNSKLNIWCSGLEFDWIVGNPPWTKADEEKQPNAYEWITNNSNQRPVGNLSLAEAFSWHVADIVKKNGIIGLLLPATSLVNLKSRDYRQAFFQHYEVIRITNFSNLRELLFDDRSALPPSSVIYRKAGGKEEKSKILHYGPFYVNQIPIAQGTPWTITINESEVQEVSYSEAIEGKTATWKLALWGTEYDERALDRLRRLFPITLEQFCEKMQWANKLPREGVQLRYSDGTSDERKTSNDKTDKEKRKDKLKHYPDLLKFDEFNTDKFNLPPRCRYSIPTGALTKNQKAYLRVHGGEGGLYINHSPHVILSAGWDFFIYSDLEFIIPPRLMGIAGQKKGDSDCLRALSVYLSSSLVRYYLFFQVPEWGVFRHRETVVVSEVRKIPTPMFTQEQIEELASLQQFLVEREQAEINVYADTLEKVHAKLQKEVDKTVNRLFHIPEDIAILAEEFVNIRLSLDEGKSSVARVVKEPNRKDLDAYASILCDQLDDFAMNEFYHRIKITKSSEFIECRIEITEKKPDKTTGSYSVIDADLPTAKFLSEIRKQVGEQFSQWVYIQKGLKLFENHQVFIYKSPRLINWTKTQAFNDAGEIIGQAMSGSRNNRS